MLSDGDRLKLDQFFRDQTDVLAAFLFGSLARGDAHARSDIDIAVLLDRSQPIRPMRQAELLSELLQLLRRNDVDLVILNSATPLMMHRVARDGTVLYARSNADVAEFVLHAVQQFEDTRPLRELQRQQLYRRIEESRKDTP